MIDKEALSEIQAELARAMQKHTTPMRSLHEGYAILLEEVDELWQIVKLQEPNPLAIRDEARQIAAMAARIMVDLT